MQDIRIERIVMVGVPKNFLGETVKVTQGGKQWDTTVLPSNKPNTFIIRDPKVRIGEDWVIQF